MVCFQSYVPQNPPGVDVVLGFFRFGKPLQGLWGKGI